MTIQSAKQAIKIKTALLECKNLPNFDKIASFASAEHLAHTVAYDLAANFNPREPLIVVDEDGKTRAYTVTHIETKDPAIQGYILAGIDILNPRVHIVFRGSADRASLVRNLEHGGAGQNSFYNEKDLIISQVNAVIAQRAYETDQNITLSVSGHSLGGADAQNFFTTLINAMTLVHRVVSSSYKAQNIASNIENLKDSFQSASSIIEPLSLVDSITLNHVNSAGITYATAQQCKNSATILAEKTAVKINVRALRVDGDWLQKSGQSNVLSDVTPNIAKVEILNIRTNVGSWACSAVIVACIIAYYISPIIAAGTLACLTAYGIFKAHTTHNFDKTLRQEDYHYCDNSTTEGAKFIKQRLSDKSTIDNNTLTYFFKEFLHRGTSKFIHKRTVSPLVNNIFQEFQLNHINIPKKKY